VTAFSPTNPDRVLWPATGFTKGDMLAYYEAVAPVLLPHLAGRPLTLGRFPSGVEGPGFATTECRGRPDWVRTASVRLRSGQVREQCVVDDVRSLLWVVNLGSIELHGFPSAAGRLEEPAFIVLDLDPGDGVGLAECCRVGLWLRELLAEEELRGFAKTSGGIGLHIYVPLAPGHRFSETKAFARALAARLAGDRPEAVTGRRDRALRSGRVLVDWLPNGPRALTVVPYSLRATDLPAASTPVDWEEIEREASGPGGNALRFSPADVLERSKDGRDPFRPVLRLQQRLQRPPGMLG
jgi:bifunctional non-homologous end joining protein LigD